MRVCQGNGESLPGERQAAGRRKGRKVRGYRRQRDKGTCWTGEEAFQGQGAKGKGGHAEPRGTQAGVERTTTSPRWMEFLAQVSFKAGRSRLRFTSRNDERLGGGRVGKKGLGWGEGQGWVEGKGEGAGMETGARVRHGQRQGQRQGQGREWA